MKTLSSFAATLPVMAFRDDGTRRGLSSPSWHADREADYMSRISKGDRQAFSQIVNLYMLDIYHFACSILGDKSKAEDITQEVCLKLWTSANQWSPEGRIKSWLFRITRNLCIDDIRRRKSFSPVDETIFAIPDPSQDAAAHYADTQLAKLVGKALFSLPERQRSAIVLVHYSGYSNIEGAKIIDVSVDAFESLLSRGRVNLRRELSEHKKSIFE